jgi:hypothetical protein
MMKIDDLLYDGKTDPVIRNSNQLVPIFLQNRHNDTAPIVGKFNTVAN